MLGVTHMVVAATFTSLGIGTADSTLVVTGAIASLLPDIDLSVSPAGRVLPWISKWLERRFPHRSCTHSLLASGIVALASYPAATLGYIPYSVVHAINIGYFAGWFADIFSRNGVEMFWPSSIRAVCPGNRNLRLQTGSPVEYVILAMAIAGAIFVFNMNANGGAITQFNRLMASSTGVEQIYNQKGSNHLIIAHIEGVLAVDRTPVVGNYWLIQGYGRDFIVESKSGEIYKVGSDPDCQILTEKITADPGPVATTSVEPVILNEEQIASKLQQFNHPKAMVFVSGHLVTDDAETLRLIAPNSYQFPTIRVEGSTVTLDVAPLRSVLTKLGEEFATGDLSIRSIYVQSQATPDLGS